MVGPASPILKKIDALAKTSTSDPRSAWPEGGIPETPPSSPEPHGDTQTSLPEPGEDASSKPAKLDHNPIASPGRRVYSIAGTPTKLTDEPSAENAESERILGTQPDSLPIYEHASSLSEASPHTAAGSSQQTTSPEERSHPLGLSMSKRKRPDMGWDNEEGFGGYMRHKTRKLREQFRTEYGGRSSGKSNVLLRGVAVWVDGYTTPTRLQLRDILGRHGGQLETYFTGKVTHIVAETLAAATIKRLKSKTKGGFKVVRPEWVVRSVKEGRRLDEKLFPVKGMGDPTQKSVLAMFGKRKKGK